MKSNGKSEQLMLYRKVIWGIAVLGVWLYLNIVRGPKNLVERNKWNNGILMSISVHSIESLKWAIAVYWKDDHGWNWSGLPGSTHPSRVYWLYQQNPALSMELPKTASVVSVYMLDQLLDITPADQFFKFIIFSKHWMDVIVWINIVIPSSHEFDLHKQS